LSREHLSKIVDIQLNTVARLFEARKMKLEVTPAAKDRIIGEGFDPQFGARPMRRAIQRLVQDPLALELLNGAYAPGDTVVADAPPEAAGLSFAKGGSGGGGSGGPAVSEVVGQTPWSARDAPVPLFARRVSFLVIARGRPGGRRRTGASANRRFDND
jgi:hypothetical protein